MTLVLEAETLARKIDETRKDVKTLHPLMQLLNTEESDPASEFAAKMIELLKEVREDQGLIRRELKHLLSNGQMALQSDSPPSDLKTLLDRLESDLQSLPTMIEALVDAQATTAKRMRAMEKQVQEIHSIFSQILN